MNYKLNLVLGTCTLLLCGLLSTQLFGQSLPEGKGKAEFVHNCTACHRADMVIRVKKTPEDWRKSVDEMAARGTDGTKEDLDNVVLYLDTYFALDGTKTPADAKQPATPSSVPSGHPPLSSPNTDRVKRFLHAPFPAR